MHSSTDPMIHSPVAPDQIDILQHVFDMVRIERGLLKESPEALDLARHVIHLYFDGVHEEAALFAATRAADRPSETAPSHREP